jgi:hypothetical protein
MSHANGEPVIDEDGLVEIEPDDYEKVGGGWGVIRMVSG